jgi:hypothetical protein
LLFISKEAQKQQIPTPCITFDQPLYIKAVDICNAAKLDVVVRLGGFHTLMSFLGSVGYVMRGSGLEDLLGLLYGAVTVDSVLSGKSYARAVRGHILVHDALTHLLLTSLLPCAEDEREKYGVVVSAADGSNVQGVLDSDTMRDLETIYKRTWSNHVSTTDCD